MRTATMTVSFALALLAVAPVATRADDTLADKIQGTYNYVSGKKGDEAIDKDRLAGKVKITKDTIYLLGEGGEEEFVIPYTFSADGTSRGKLKMEIKKGVVAEAVGSTARGLVKLEGDTLTLIYDFQEGRSPEDFTPKDAMQHLYILKRSAAK